jgi:GTPase SAR1 family protein
VQLRWQDESVMPLQFTFVTSAKRHVDLPESPCEVAFVGRSNVGKSSLINALANRKQLARVCSSPMSESPTKATVRLRSNGMALQSWAETDKELSSQVEHAYCRR